MFHVKNWSMHNLTLELVLYATSVRWMTVKKPCGKEHVVPGQK